MKHSFLIAALTGAAFTVGATMPWTDRLWVNAAAIAAVAVLVAATATRAVLPDADWNQS